MGAFSLIVVINLLNRLKSCSVRIKRLSIANRRCLMIKYARDTRYDNDCMATHDQVTITAVSANYLEEISLVAQKYDVIGIDEGQFFKDVVSFSEQFANNGRTVIVAALDGNFRREPFNDILYLLPLAESVVKLTAVCTLCYESASFTKRVGSETELEVIGGSDKYIASCRQCFAKKMSEKSLNKTFVPDVVLADVSNSNHCSRSEKCVPENNENAMI